MRWQAEIERFKQSHRHRALALSNGVDFTSNDYLGLANHPALREALIAALERDGMVGAGGSRLLRGHHEEHARLETFAAKFFGAERALYFGSGFLANFAHGAFVGGFALPAVQFASDRAPLAGVWRLGALDEQMSAGGILQKHQHAQLVRQGRRHGWRKPEHTRG